MNNYEQVGLWDHVLENKVITKPIRLIEMFGGVGSQHESLKRLGFKIDRTTLVEWAVPSIQAYNDIHIRDYYDYSHSLTLDGVIDFLSSKGVSMNYNEPMTRDQLKRKSDQWLRKVYNNIIATNNLVNIQQVRGRDLKIDKTNQYEYVLTYSFPCQDLSVAGLKKGMSRGSNTRSGLLWEVERILQELKDEKMDLPQILLMENVPDVISKTFIKDFQEWELFLSNLGYSNFVELLNAKNYGVPQSRNRAFMVSILGEYNYKFPQRIPLTKKLKDLLETNVDEKYYLSTEKLQAIQNWKAQQDPLKDIDKPKDISPTLTARGAGEEHSGMILINESLFTDTQAQMITPDGNVKRYINSEIIDEFQEGDCADISFPNGYEKGNRVQKGVSPTLNTTTTATSFIVKVGNYSPSNHNAATIVDPEGLAPTVMENHGTVTAIAIPEATEKGYKLATDGDGVYLNRPHQKRGTVQKEMMPTLVTNGDDYGVVVKDENMKTKLVNELITSGTVQGGEVINHSYTTSDNRQELKDYIETTDGISPTLTTRPDVLGYVEQKEISNAVRTGGRGSTDRHEWDLVSSNLRIRKLTPRECWRLMGFSDQMFDRASENQSNASLYHLAGDSIVVDVLMAIFGKLKG